ncbi:GLE1-like protein-domain-containing protein [Limtongia smithiae]|uniref:GLE1-like protein-domain-containing protein n=1 Tax=Limtongia smithiae TaxID=1125753 RepID=UPI0034CE941C
MVVFSFNSTYESTLADGRQAAPNSAMQAEAEYLHSLEDELQIEIERLSEHLPKIELSDTTGIARIQLSSHHDRNKVDPFERSRNRMSMLNSIIENWNAVQSKLADESISLDESYVARQRRINLESYRDHDSNVRYMSARSKNMWRRISDVVVEEREHTLAKKMKDDEAQIRRKLRENADKERLKMERQEKLREEQERISKNDLEMERLQKELLQLKQQEKERLAKEAEDKERLERERQAAAELAEEKRQLELKLRAEHERHQQLQLEQERRETERKEQEAEQKTQHIEQAQRDAQERATADRLEQERLQVEKAMLERQKEETRLKERLLHEQQLKQDRERLKEQAEYEQEQAAKPVQRPLSTTVASGVVLDEAKAEYDYYHQIILVLKSDVNAVVAADKQLKSYCSTAKRKIRPKLGQLTNSTQQILRVLDDLSRVLLEAQNTSEICYVWLLNFLCKSVVQQAETETTVSPQSAYPLGTLAMFITSKHPLLRELIMARIIKKCPYIIGYWCPIDTEQGRKRMGYRRIDEKWEDDAMYSERMAGIASVWGVMTQIGFSLKSGTRHPYPISHSWTFATRTLNIPTEALTNTHFTVVAAWWDLTSRRFLTAYGRVGERILETMSDSWTQSVSSKRYPAAARLRILGEQWKKTGVTGMERPVEP